MANRLKLEHSPYLLQHAENPVDWYPWGTEALEKAKNEEKPIFLSIGYSACHWCHVMEKESFENEAVAKLLNEFFVSIKVDREERPDIDHIYMSAVQAMTQQGGWPLSIFLTPDKKPFYGGTYFPPEDRMGLPGFKNLLSGIANAWGQRRQEVLRSAEDLTSALKQMADLSPHLSGKSQLDLRLVDEAIEKIHERFDPDFGGFGSAPKFFHTMDLRLCLRAWKRNQDPKAKEIVETTLRHVCRGGIFDHLAGGVHRYSTDRRWLVPHFEKMLYDNALVSQVLLEAYQAFRDSEFLESALKILNYCLDEMKAPGAGFYSTQDADSEGIEGKYFVWRPEEILKILGRKEGELFCRVYDITPNGNWDYKCILNLRKPLKTFAKELGIDLSELSTRLETSRVTLLNVRKKRIPPLRDEKQLTSWNGMLISSLCLGFRITQDARYLMAARESATFIQNHVWDSKEDRLFHCYQNGNPRFNGYLEDYAHLIIACTEIYETEFDSKWLEFAGTVAHAMVEKFWNDKDSFFDFTSKDHEDLLVKMPEIYDGATPSATSVAAYACLKLGKLLDQENLLKIGERTLQKFYRLMKETPQAASQFLVGLDFILNDPTEIVLIGNKESKDFKDAIDTMNQKFLPNAVRLTGTSGQTQLKRLETLSLQAKDLTLYLCQNWSCKNPVTGKAIIEAINSLS